MNENKIKVDSNDDLLEGTRNYKFCFSKIFNTSPLSAWTSDN